MKRLVAFLLFFIIFSVKAYGADPREITVVGDTSYAPFIFLDSHSQPKGIFVDLWKLWSEKTKVQVNFKLVPWNEALNLAKEKSNHVICGFFYSEERAKYFDFSKPYLKLDTNIFFHKDIYGIKDLDSLSGFNIGVVKGDYAYKYIKNRHPEYTIITFNTVTDLFHSVFNNEIKVFIIDKPVGLFFLSQNKKGNEFKISSKPLYSLDVVAGVKKGNRELLQIINLGFSKIKQSEKEEILKEWQGTEIIDLKKIIIAICFLISATIVFFLWNFILQKKINKKTEELIELNQKFKTTLMSIGDALITTDDKGKITIMNPVAEQLTGWKKEEAIGRSLNEVFHIINGVTGEPAMDPVKKVFETGKVQGLANHTILISKNGKRYHIADSAAPILDKNNYIIGCVLIFRDVTEEYTTTQYIAKQQKIIERACDIAKIAISEFDNSGNLVFANSVAYSVFDVDKGISVTRDFLLSLILPQDVPKVKENLKKLNKGEFVTLNFRLKSPKTKIIKEIFATGELDKNTNNTILVGQDITYFTKLKEKLVQSEEKYKALFDQSPLGIIVYDKDTTITECNEVFATGIGTQRENLIGFNMKDNINNKGVLQAVLDSLDKGMGYYEGEYTSVLGNKTGYVRCIFKAIRNEKNEITGGVGIVQDLTELEKHRQEMFKLAKLESIGTLAGGIAHDFNNLLTGIFGQINLAKTKLKPTHESYNNLLKAEEVLDRAKRITNQLLSLTKGWEPVLEPIDLKGFLKNIVEFDLSGSRVKPVYNFPEKISPIMGVLSQLERALSNIIINAKQAMEQGGTLEVTLSNRKIDREDEIPGLQVGEYVCIEIKDSGDGIDKNVLDKIFDPFFTTKPNGTGLGLTTSFSIIKKHGGTILVKSKMGVGTTFIIYLPSIKEEKSSVKEEIHIPQNISKQGKILFLDDEEMLQEIVKEALAMHGFSVDVASTGEEAIKKYKDAYHSGNPYSLVIMDLTIPGGMGGKETIREILKINKDAKCVITSGYGDDPVLANYKKYGFKAALQKPFQLETLIRMVNELI